MQGTTRPLASSRLSLQKVQADVGVPGTMGQEGAAVLVGEMSLTARVGLLLHPQCSGTQPRNLRACVAHGRGC